MVDKSARTEDTRVNAEPQVSDLTKGRLKEEVANKVKSLWEVRSLGVSGGSAGAHASHPIAERCACCRAELRLPGA